MYSELIGNYKKYRIKSLYDNILTINSPSNMIRQFNTNIKETSMVLGQLFIPVLQKVMPVVNGTTIAIKRLLVSVAQLMGVKIDFEAFGQNGYQDTSDGLEDIADGYDDVAKAADKAQKGIRGFDELNVINTGTDASKSTGVSGDTIDLTDEIVKATEEYEKVWNDAFDKMENKAEAWADKIGDFFQRMFKPLKTWGDKINWKTLKNGLNGILDFAKKFTVSTGKGFLDFVEGLANIGAPIINGIGTAVGILFKALNLVPTPVWQALGGALGGVLTVFLGFKAYSSIAGGINNGIGKFADAILKLSGTKPAEVGNGVSKLSTAISALGSGGYVVLAITALAAVAGAIISVEQAYRNMVDEFVDTSVFDNQGTAISDIAQSVIELIDSTGTSSEDMTNFATELERVSTNLQNASEEVDNLKFHFDNLGLENVTDNDIENMKTAVGNLASALRDDLQVSSDMAWTALKNMSETTARQLGIDVGTMTTILSQFNARFNGIYNDMESQANVIFDKMLNGTATQADVDSLNSLLDDMDYLSGEAIKRQVELQNSFKDMTDINFQSVEETTKAISDITQAGQAKLNEVDEYYKSLIDQADEWKIYTERALERGKITEEEASQYLNWVGNLKDIYNANWGEEKEAITSQIGTTFEYIQSQVEKAGVETFQNAQKKDWGIVDWFKNPVQGAVKNFDNDIFKPILAKLNEGMETLDIEPPKDNHLYQRWLENSTMSENDVSGWAMQNANVIGNAILANADITTKAFADMAGYDVSGYTDAMKEHEPKLNRLMVGIGDSILKGFATSHDIHSPSKKFAKLALYDVLGYNEGLSDNTNLSVIAIQKFASKVINSFQSAMLQPIGNVGVQTMNGFISGLASVEDTLYQKVDEIADRVAKTMQSALDIHSPSRVMFELGAYTTEGFKEGMESLYKPTELSIKDFGFGMVEAVHPQQLYSGYADYTPSVSTSTSTTTQNYYNTSSSVDNAETNALLRELISAVKQGSKIEIDGKAIGNVVRKEDRSYFQRTGRGLFEH